MPATNPFPGPLLHAALEQLTGTVTVGVDAGDVVVAGTAISITGPVTVTYRFHAGGGPTAGWVAVERDALAAAVGTGPVDVTVTDGAVTVDGRPVPGAAAGPPALGHPGAGVAVPADRLAWAVRACDPELGAVLGDIVQFDGTKARTTDGYRAFDVTVEGAPTGIVPAAAVRAVLAVGATVIHVAAGDQVVSVSASTPIADAVATAATVHDSGIPPFDDLHSPGAVVCTVDAAALRDAASEALPAAPWSTDRTDRARPLLVADAADTLVTFAMLDRRDMSRTTVAVTGQASGTASVWIDAVDVIDALDGPTGEVTLSLPADSATYALMACGPFTAWFSPIRQP